jgi:hypothetical protein
MLANDCPNRRPRRLFLGLALGIPYLIAGCGDGGGDKPVPVDAVQVKKAQQYMAGYREQIIADNKAKAKAKATGKATGKAAEKATEKAAEKAAAEQSP